MALTEDEFDNRVDQIHSLTKGMSEDQIQTVMESFEDIEVEED